MAFGAAAGPCLAQAGHAASDASLADMATTNPWAAWALIALRESRSLSHVGSGEMPLPRFPSADAVHALLAGDRAAANALAPLASHKGRVAWHVEPAPDGKPRLALSSVVVDDDGRVMFKVYRDIEVDVADPALAWREAAARAPNDDPAASHPTFAMMAARPADEAAALRIARAYSTAWMARDVDRIVSLSHPILAIKMGGIANYRKFIAGFFEQMKDADFSHGGEAIGTPSYELVSGRSRMIGIPGVRKVPGLAVTPSVYVVVSYDEGRTWSVLSLGCTDERWLEALVPGYRGSPDILGRGNPAVRDFVDRGSFDEAVFLRGPRYTMAH
jgi:hypothetical protein